MRPRGLSSPRLLARIRFFAYRFPPLYDSTAVFLRHEKVRHRHLGRGSVPVPDMLAPARLSRLPERLHLCTVRAHACRDDQARPEDGYATLSVRPV